MIIETDNFLFDNESFVVTTKNGLIPSFSMAPFFDTEIKEKGINPYTLERPLIFEPEIKEGYKLFYWPEWGAPFFAKNQNDYLRIIFNIQKDKVIKDFICKNNVFKIMFDDGGYITNEYCEKGKE